MSDFNVSFDPPKDGGPAFPSHGSMGEVVSEGMSLRDYFAAKAMQALLTRPGGIDPKNDAEFSFHLADAMLKARRS